MLLLDDDDELPSTPAQGEASLTAKLSAEALERIDAALIHAARPSWLKVARIVYEAVEAGRFDPSDDGCLHLHVRRIIQLTHVGALEAQGNLRRPRWSEVRISNRAAV